MQNEWFKEWFDSAFYHKLYFNRNKQEANEFILRLLRFLQPDSQSRMLDAACGRGRHATFLASQGFEVTGFDLSFQSIAYAKQFETDNLHFYQHDMRLPFWINYFDFAFNFFTSFGYFNTRREHDDAVRTLAQSVKKGGVLLFDYLNVHYAEDHLVHNETKTVDETEFEIHRWHSPTHFFKRIVVRDAALEKPFEVTEKVAKFTLGDFTEMLAFQNVQVQDVFGDYELSPYHVNDTPRLIIVGRKRPLSPGGGT